MCVGVGPLSGYDVAQSRSLVGSVQDSTTLYGAYRVQVVGNLVYVAAPGVRADGLHILDRGQSNGRRRRLEQGESPGDRDGRRADRRDQTPLVGRLRDQLLSNNADVVVRGRYAQVIDQITANGNPRANFVVLEIADPSHPEVVASTSSP